MAEKQPFKFSKKDLDQLSKLMADESAPTQNNDDTVVTIKERPDPLQTPVDQGETGADQDQRQPNQKGFFQGVMGAKPDDNLDTSNSLDKSTDQTKASFPDDVNDQITSAKIDQLTDGDVTKQDLDKVINNLENDPKTKTILEDPNIKAAIEEINGLADGLTPEQIAESQARVDLHISSGGSLTDDIIANEPVVIAARIQQQNHVAERFSELAASLNNLEELDEQPQHPSVLGVSGKIAGPTRGVARTALKAGTATVGTIATAKGSYMSLLAIGQEMGLSLNSSVLFYGSLGFSSLITAGLVAGGYKISQTGGYKKFAKENPKKATFFTACVLVSATYAAAFLEKNVATAERASEFGDQQLNKLNLFSHIAKNGIENIPSLKALMKKIIDRRLAVVKAEVDPSLRGKGVGDSGLAEGYGPIAQGTDYGLRGKYEGVPKKYIQAVAEVRKKYGLPDGMAIEQKYLDIILNNPDVQRTYAEMTQKIYAAADFTQKVKEKEPHEYVPESVSITKSEIDPQLINGYIDAVKKAAKIFAESLNKTAREEARVFIKNYTTDLFAALGQSKAGIEIPNDKIEIDTTVLDTIDSFTTSILPFPSREEHVAIGKFLDRNNLGALNIVGGDGEKKGLDLTGYFEVSKDEPSIEGAVLKSLVVLLFYMLCIDNLATFAQASYERKRRRMEADSLPEALEKLHTKEQGLIRAYTNFINLSLLPTTEDSEGDKNLVDEDFVRYRLREMHEETFTGRANQSAAAQMFSKLGSVGSGVRSFVWGGPMEDTKRYNSYNKFLDSLIPEFDQEKQVQNFVDYPAHITEVLVRIIPDAAKHLMVPESKSDQKRGRVEVAQSTAEFYKKRISIVTALLNEIENTWDPNPTTQRLSAGQTLPLDGSKTIVIDPNTAQESSIIYALRKQLEDDYKRFGEIAATGSRAQATLNQDVLRHNTARSAAAATIGDYKDSDKKIILSSGRVLPSFILGSEAEESGLDLEKTLSPDQGLYASMADTLREQYSLRANPEVSSEMLREIDAGILADLRKNLAETEELRNMQISAGAGFRRDDDGFASFALVLKVINPDIPEYESEISYGFDPEIEKDELIRQIEQWYADAKNELVAQALFSQHIKNKLDAAKEIFGERISPNQALPNVELDQYLSSDPKKLLELMQLNTLHKRLRSFVDTLPKNSNEYSLGNINQLSEKQLEIMKQDHNAIQIPGLESNERFGIISDLLTAIQENKNLLRSYKFVVNLEKHTLEVIEKNKPKRKTQISFDQLGSTDSLQAKLESLFSNQS